MFSVALVLPAGVFNRECPVSRSIEPEQLSGLSLFLLGPLGMIGGAPAAFPWIANVLLVVGSVLLGAGKQNMSAATSMITLTVGCSFGWVARVYPFAADEGGVCYDTLVTLGAGYWLWIGVLLVPLLASGVPLLAQWVGNKRV